MDWAVMDWTGHCWRDGVGVARGDGMAVVPCVVLVGGVWRVQSGFVTRAMGCMRYEGRYGCLLKKVVVEDRQTVELDLTYVR